MNTVLLGKAIKAMYKLSGKTLAQLCEETDLTIDTINNLFYGRLQKPSFLGVSALVKATGHTVSELSGFLETAERLPADADFTDEFAKYLFSAERTGASADATKTQERSAAPAADTQAAQSYVSQMKELNEEHERQLDRYRATHLHYVEQLQERYKEQIAQMEESLVRLKEHYDHSVGEIKKANAQEMERREKEISVLKRMNLLLTLALMLVAIGAVVIVMLLVG